MRFLHERGLDGLAARAAALDDGRADTAEDEARVVVLAFFVTRPEAEASVFEETAAFKEAEEEEDDDDEAVPEAEAEEAEEAEEEEEGEEEEEEEEVDRSASLTSR